MQYSNETLLDGSSIEKSRFWLSWKFFVKHGISEYFGLSLKTNLASVITDAKYQYFDGEVLDMAFDLGIKASSFPQIKDNEIVYDTFYSIYPAALFTFKLSDKFGTSLGMEHKKIYNINPEGEESSASFKGGSVNNSAGEEFNFIFQPSYFTGRIFKNNEVVLRSIGIGLAFLFD